MLDMGFEEDVRYIISQCKTKETRQTAMFSATWPAAIQQLAMEFMINPVCIYIGFESIVGSNGENAIDDSLSIYSFTNDPDVCVLLLSMRAGAAGLNLMAANYCFLLDPATNSAIEEQAIDRIHRIGQTRPVTVKRFIMKDSVEERVLQNRRSLAADRPNTSVLLDGSGDLEEEEKLAERNQTQTRERHEDENGMGEKSFQRLRHLEALFGCEATVKVTKA